MIALKMLTSDRPLFTARDYLARIDEKYFTIKVFDPTLNNRAAIPYKEAVYVITGNDVTSAEPVTKIHELAEIA